jgi:hypothetical protein
MIMIDQINLQALDMTIFVVANFVHLVIAIMFIARAQGARKLANAAGNASVAMILPLGMAVVLNSLVRRDWWMIVLPAVLLAFLVIELLFDYILKLDFRNTRLLWPYLLAYYLGLNAMIGYTFQVGKVFGFITLVTYFINLAATWYSYSRVKHGQVRTA